MVISNLRFWASKQWPWQGASKFLLLIHHRSKTSLKLVVHLPITFLLPHSLPYILFYPQPQKVLVSPFSLIRSQWHMKIKAKIPRNQNLLIFEGREDWIFKSSLEERKYFHSIFLEVIVFFSVV